MALTNPGFETGDYTGWEQLSRSSTPFPTINVSTTAGYVDSGTYSAHVQSPGSGVYEVKLRNEWRPLISPESIVTVSARCRGGPEKGGQFVSVGVDFFDAANNLVASFASGEVANADLRGGFVSVSWSGRAPAGAASASMWILPRVNTYSNRHVYMDSCTMTVTEITGEAVSITFPVTGSTYHVGDTIPFRVAVLAGTPIASLKYEVTNTSTAETTDIPSTGVDWRADVNTLEEASYSVVAVATLTNSTTITSSAHTFTVGAAAALPTREYKASNAYTQMVLQNFQNLAASMPPTAIVTGAEIEVDYKLQFLIRSKDKDLDDPSVARYEAAFLVAPSVVIAAQALEPEGSALTAIGTPATASRQLQLSDFSVIENGSSEGKRWTVLENGTETITLGSEDSVFGLQQVQAGAFLDYSVGLRAYPQLGTKPEWADSGDACIRVLFDKVRLRVYFDAGSVEYYFVDPINDSNVIKGTLAAVYVDEGDLRNGDAGGIMQLLPELDPDTAAIPAEYNIHSALPPTNRNWIGRVATDMEYNGLPSYADVIQASRSRYVFITSNFYGDPLLNSIYGVNGVDRGFAYNGDYFYKITTHPDPEQDKPRHVAYHHGHLALGYRSGRVDISVVGEPWNYSGVDGASSWAIGDEVTGLLPLPGTILGIYGRKSIIGLSGTTVDNFATQTISPKLGAVEYTVADMGFPVHANAYGIYTLSQTSSYGDYLGIPLSQQVSPWLRPRLVRSSTSDREVVVAWPVRSKNQYKLAFADGYVLTMTMNYGNQSAPTFSKQKYFLPADSCSNIQEEPEGDPPYYIIDNDWWESEERIYITPPNTAVGEFTEYLLLEPRNHNNVWIEEDQSGHLDWWINSTDADHFPVFTELTEHGWAGKLGCVTFGSPAPSDGAMVPAAVSSELDDSGEERIHIANKVVPQNTPAPPQDCASAIPATWRCNNNNTELSYEYLSGAPDWLYPVDTDTEPALHIDFYDDGNDVPYYYSTEFDGWYKHGEYPTVTGPETGRGVIYSADYSQSVCFNWNIGYCA